ncbi:hypothetical protein TREES_T100009799 [Tupaia chinensis]|uniref:Uncharacterized protein n=1 Tax=Tupaia chinensis TaxID=246437 RepID=L9KQG2_TUPCH|nr:hypothetical protein TREES_T100009799 [Tupaia chinensis]
MEVDRTLHNDEERGPQFPHCPLLMNYGLQHEAGKGRGTMLNSRCSFLAAQVHLGSVVLISLCQEVDRTLHNDEERGPQFPHCPLLMNYGLQHEAGKGRGTMLNRFGIYGYTILSMSINVSLSFNEGAMAKAKKLQHLSDLRAHAIGTSDTDDKYQFGFCRYTEVASLSCYPAHVNLSSF